MGTFVPAIEEHEALLQLESEDYRRLLDDIDSLRRADLYQVIDLPTIVVCGDTSAGKSSLLESISGGIRFPIDTTVCTRFATELVLRRGDHRVGRATVTAGPSASVQHREAVKHFVRDFDRFEELDDIFAQAKKAMKVDGSSAFTDDVLYLEVSGPSCCSLTLIDLPGLIHAGHRKSGSDFVRQLVSSYTNRHRSIILAVIPADAVPATQEVLRLAAESDPTGGRTVGVITKPDLAGVKGHTPEMVDLAMNRHETFIFKRPWQVIKNPSYAERLRAEHPDHTNFDRDRCERQLRQTRPWNELADNQWGLTSLIQNLQIYLLELIQQGLGPIQEEIKDKIAACKAKLDILGGPRDTANLQRSYLSGLSEQYTQLVHLALDGRYQKSAFLSEIFWPQRQLRSRANEVRLAFEQHMISRGATFSIVSSTDIPAQNAFSTITLADYLTRANDRCRKLGGTELPSVINHEHIPILFNDNSVKWSSIASEFIGNYEGLVKSFILETVTHICCESRDTANRILSLWFSDMIDKQVFLVRNKLAEVLLPYTSLVPFASESRMLRALDRIKAWDFEEGKKMDKVATDTLHQRIGNLDSCLDFTQKARAYYEVIMETFVDNFVLLVIENCLMDQIPQLFNAQVVNNMDEATLEQLGGEPVSVVREREENQEKLAILQQALQTCRKHAGFHQHQAPWAHAEGFENVIWNSTTKQSGLGTAGARASQHTVTSPTIETSAAIPPMHQTAVPVTSDSKSPGLRPVSGILNSLTPPATPSPRKGPPNIPKARVEDVADDTDPGSVYF